MAKRYKPNFDRDWNFYLAHKDRFTFCGEAVETPKLDREAYDAKRCFHRYDSQGKYPESCSQPELFMEVLRAKKSINWQIKQWAEGYNDCILSITDYMESFTDPPQWVEEALRKMRDKIRKQQK